MRPSLSAPELSVALVAYLRGEGRTLREIGNMIGLSESFVSRVSNGERSFTIEHLELFERQLGEPLPALIMRAMWEHDINPKEQPAFDEALRLLRELGTFRRSLAGRGDAQKHAVASTRRSSPGAGGHKRAAG